MQSAAFKKPKLAEQYVKSDVMKKMPDTTMSDKGTVVKPKGKSMAKIRKKSY